MTAAADAPLDAIHARFEVEWARAQASLRPADVETLRALAYALTRAGRHAEALEVDLRLVALAPDRADLHYDLACSQALTGAFEEAFASLDRALDLGFEEADLLEQDEDLEALRDDPRFARMLARLRT